VVQVKVKLSQQERDRYKALMQMRNDFLRSAKITSAVSRLAAVCSAQCAITGRTPSDASAPGS